MADRYAISEESELWRAVRRARRGAIRGVYMLKHARQGNTLTVRLVGELDQDSATRVRQELDDLIADVRVKHLVLDMKELTFMDSSGIGVVIGRYRTLAQRGGGVAVRGESPHVQRIMKLSGLYSILENSR